MDAGIGIGGLNHENEEYTHSKFDLFGSTEYEVGVKKSISQSFRPMTSASSLGPFSFVIPSDPEKFTDAESLRLHGRMKIMKKEPSSDVLSNLNGEYVSPVNNIFNSLWSAVNVKLNGCDISDPSSKWYAYKAYFENHLSYSTSTKKNILPYKGYILDTIGKFDDVGNSSNTTASQNDGFIKRQELFATSRWVYFCINLHNDITTLRKHIPPGVKIEIDFERNPDSFCLLSDKQVANFQIELDDLRLTVNRIAAGDSILKYYHASLQNKLQPRLPIDRSMLKTYTVSSGNSDLSEYNIISGKQLPEQVIVAIVDEDAHRGVMNKNPFNFKDFNLTEASLVVNGVHEPQEVYKLNKSTGDKVDLYEHFLENTGISNDDREFGITMDDYYGGSFMLVWDRTPDKCNRFHRHVMDSGSMSINLKTSAPLGNTVTVIVYATYTKDLIIDGDRVITEAF